jgi:WD40 repeat protein
VRIWDTRTGQQQHQLTGHTASVNAVAYAPDGATVATAGEDSTVRIWDTRTGQQQHQLTGHTSEVWSVAYAPDGATLATGGNDGTARIWDTRTGQQQHQIAGHTGQVLAVAYAPDGATLATGGNDGVVRIWDTGGGQQQQQLAGHRGWIRSVAYAPDGTTVATGGRDGTARIWDTRTGQQQHQLTGHTGPVLAVAYAADGTTVATGGDTTIRIWNPRNGAQVDGTGFGVTRRIGRPLAGVRSDAPSERDLIEAASDVETLADLIAAAETSPPLAIALIGDWGVGKSSVMLQIQRRIETLAKMSRNNPGLSVFASNVRQVRFNAWDYSDDQLWSGLVDHLFRVLAADPDSSSASPDPGTVEAERRILRENLAEQEAAGERLGNGLRAADRAVQPQGFLAWLGSPAYTWRVVGASIRELAREIRSAPWVLLGWAALGAIAYVVWSLWGSTIGAAAAAVAAVIAPAAVTGQRLRSWHRTGMGATGRLRRRLDQRQRAINQKIADLRERLALIDASARLSAFLTDRAAPSAYQEYRGLLGQVRSDLAALSSDLTAARNEWLVSEATTPPPLERIVLYIDDLDRCPPRRVVEVLEAVHLMLALDLFVVVVAVDARWLVRSLEYHYQELFSTGDGPVPTAPARSPDADAEAGPASPVDYLDKIFQIPYVLAPPPPAAMASYLRTLLPPASSPTTTPQIPATVTAMESMPAEPGADPNEGEDPLAIGTEDLPQHDDEFTVQLPPRRSDDDPRQRAGKTGHRAEKEQPPTPRIEQPDTAIPDLRPLGLQVSQPEAEFMTRLGPLLPTPRAAKKLVNLYRLVRIGIPDSGLAGFTGSEAGGQYQVVQILLAILVGSPAAAQRIFRELMAATPEGDILTVFAKTGAADSPESNLCARIGAELRRISEDTPLMLATSEYQRWCPTLARYSFHTRTMTARPPSIDAPASLPHDRRGSGHMTPVSDRPFGDDSNTPSKSRRAIA